MLTLRALHGEPAEMAELQRVLESAPAYFQTVCGLPPGPSEANILFSMLPDGRNYDDKFVYGLYAYAQMIGCADVIRGYPMPHKAVLGLLLLAQPWQRRGIGRAFATLIEQTIATWPAITTLRIGVVASNTGALAFWHKVGYSETGEIRPSAPPFIADTIVLEKPLARDARAWPAPA